MSVAAIILAAGRGSRFGSEPKMLAELDGKPLVRHVAEAALGGGALPVITVTGYRDGEVAAGLAGMPLTLVVNRRYADGLSTSLRSGFAALPADSEAAIVLLGDMPRIGPDMVARLIATWRDVGRPVALVPTHRGMRGNPVVLSRSLAPEIAGLTGDSGAGALLRRRSDVVEVEIDDPALRADVDTREALQRLAAGQASTTPSRIAT